MVIKSAFLYLVFICVNNFCFGQAHKGFQWIGTNHSIYSVDISSGMLSENTLYRGKRELGTIQNWNELKIELPGDFDINTFSNKDSLLISVPGTGQLYNFHVPTLKLKRLDETFFRGYNFNATQFFRKDTLFSIGGDGFWYKHSLITYYNPKAKEWDLYDSKNNNPDPSNFNFSGFSKKYDAFFSAYLGSDTLLKENPVYLRFYSFKQKTWQVKGKLNNDFVKFAKAGFRSVWADEFLIVFDDKRFSTIYLIDPFNNKVFLYNDTNDHFFLSNCEIYNLNENLYSRSRISSGNIDKMYFDSLSVNTLVRNSSMIGSLYEPDKMNYVTPMILLIIIAIGLIIAIIIHGVVVVFGKKILKAADIKLTETELQVINEFNAQDKKISSSELNTLLDINQKSYDNQRQIRNRAISTINQKLHLYFNYQDLILRSSNDEDKRMMDYFVNPSINFRDLEHLISSL